MSNVDNIQRFPNLETPRLFLREQSLADVEALYAILSDPDNVRFYDTLFTDVEQVRRFIERNHARFRHHEGIRWGIILKTTHSFIGSCGYIWNREHRYATVSYVLDKQYWGRGLMPEALRSMIGFAFKLHPLHRVEAEVVSPNTASMRVLQKLGFREEGIRRERYFIDGNYYDEKLFSLLRSDILNKK